MLARERDVSEKIALGVAKPTLSKHDERLFNRSSGVELGFNEDQVFDEPLFTAQEGINSIYRARTDGDDGDQANDEEIAKV